MSTVVGCVASLAGVVGLYIAVAALNSTNQQMEMSEAQWEAGGATLELVSVLASTETEVTTDPPSVRTTRSFLTYLVTNTGRLQIDIAGAQRADTEGNYHGDLACGEYPQTLAPGATGIIVFADPGNVTTISGLDVTFATGDSEYFAASPSTGRTADVLKAAYDSEIDQALAHCPTFE